MNKLTFGLLVPLCCLLISCEQSLSPHQYVQWVEQPANGLCVQKAMGNFTFQAQYKPSEYIIALEERSPQLSAKLVAQKKEELGTDLAYFNFRISPSQKGQTVLMQAAQSEADYFQLVDYFSYRMKQDLYLLEGKDTLRCELYQFARNYELAPYIDFALAFEKGAGKDRVFVYDDQVLRTGPIKMRIGQQAIQNIPTIQTQ